MAIIKFLILQTIYRRQILTSKDFIFWRLKTIPELKELSIVLSAYYLLRITQVAYLKILKTNESCFNP